MISNLKKNNTFSYLTNLHYNLINNIYLYNFFLLYLVLLTSTKTFFILDSNIIIFSTFSTFLFLGVFFLDNKNASLIMDQGFINHFIFNLLVKILTILILFLFIIKLKYIQYNLYQIQFIFKYVNNVYYLIETNKDRHIIINNLAYSALLFNSVMFLHEDTLEENDGFSTDIDSGYPCSIGSICL
jgi:hypothetical protein